jgi:hypothetical protein
MNYAVNSKGKRVGGIHRYLEYEDGFKMSLPSGRGQDVGQSRVTSNAMTIGIGIGISVEGIGVTLSEYTAVGLAAVVGWEVGGAIGSNIDTVSETIAGWLVGLGVSPEVLYAKDKLKGGKQGQRDRDYGLPPALIDWWHNGGGKAGHGGQDIGSKYGPSPGEIIQEWESLGRPSGSKPKGGSRYK